MDLHVYRTSQDRWHDLSAAARERGAVLAVNAVTLHELVQRLTPDVTTATMGQRLAVLQEFRDGGKIRTSEFFLRPEIPARYLYDAVSELKSCRVRPHELRDAGTDVLADILEPYDQALRQACLSDPQDRCALAAARVKEGAVRWLDRFERVILHAIYDLTEAEFVLVRSIIETLPQGGTVTLFNTTANVKPTQFAEWTWRRFIEDESLAEKTFPEFCRRSQPARAILEKLFVFEPHDPFPTDPWLQIVETPSRYKEAEKIGSGIGELLSSGQSPNDVAVVVRHIETYGEILEDVFTRYGIPHRFETGVPLVRVPFIKYWLAFLDLVTSERSREAMARVMSSAYFRPRLSPAVDVERALASFGYIDRNHMRASALAARKNSSLTAEIERFEKVLDDLEHTRDSVVGFMKRMPPSVAITEADRQAWRLLEDEIETVGAVYSSGCAPSPAGSRHPLPEGEGGPSLQFAQFRKIASEIAGLRTVDRNVDTPPGLPTVRLIHPHSLGSREYKWIFAPGFTDGEFPTRSPSNPLLSDRVVEAINKRIRPRRLMTARDRNRREPLYFFMILDSATRRVTLTYPGSTLEGDPMYPSVYIGEIVRHHAESPIVRDTAATPRSDGEWRSRIAEEWRKGTLVDARARALLGDDIVERAQLESKGIKRARIAGGMPVDGVWHPSELNSLSSCPFVFLARHRLKLRAPETPDFEVPASEIGILAHTILRDFYSEPVPSSIEEARSRMNEIITRRLSAADVNGQGPHSVFDPSLWKIRRRQLVSVLNRYVDFAVNDAHDGFQTLPEYLDTPLPAVAMGPAVLSGRPDHVAVRRCDGWIDAIRIDDFKYSAASSATARQLKDSFQIPVYAYLAARALEAAEGMQIEGRYLLLRSPGNPVVAQTIDSGVFEHVGQRIESLMQKVREGRLEPAPADKQTCIDCEYRRLCRLYGI